MPKTTLGKWSVYMIGAFIVLLGTGMIMAASGQTGGNTFFDNLYLAIPMLGAGVAGAAAFFVGLIAIIKQRERSPLVYITTLIGLFVIVFVLGEFLGPTH